jgi:hypothetical protein
MHGPMFPLLPPVFHGVEHKHRKNFIRTFTRYFTYLSDTFAIQNISGGHGAIFELLLRRLLLRALQSMMNLGLFHDLTALWLDTLRGLNQLRLESNFGLFVNRLRIQINKYQGPSGSCHSLGG